MVRKCYLKSRIVDLLNKMVHGDVARLQSHQQLLALGSGDQFQVERMTCQEVGDTRGELTSSMLGRSGRSRLLLVDHLIKNLLFSWSIGGD